MRAKNMARIPFDFVVSYFASNRSVTVLSDVAITGAPDE